MQVLCPYEGDTSNVLCDGVVTKVLGDGRCSVMFDGDYDENDACDVDIKAITTVSRFIKAPRHPGLNRALSRAAKYGNTQAKLISDHAGHCPPIFSDTDTFCHASARIGRTIFVTGGAIRSQNKPNRDLITIEVGEDGGAARSRGLTRLTTLPHTGLSPRFKHVSAAFVDAHGVHQLIVAGGWDCDAGEVCDSTVWRLDVHSEPRVWVVQPCTGTPPACIFESASAFDLATRTLYCITNATFALDMSRWVWCRVAPSPWLALPRKRGEPENIRSDVPFGKSGNRRGHMDLDRHGDQIAQCAAACIVHSGQPNAALCVTGGRATVSVSRGLRMDLCLMLHLPLARPDTWILVESLPCARSGHTSTACDGSDTIILVGGHRRIALNEGEQV